MSRKSNNPQQELHMYLQVLRVIWLPDFEHPFLSYNILQRKLFIIVVQASIFIFLLQTIGKSVERIVRVIWLPDFEHPLLPSNILQRKLSIIVVQASIFIFLLQTIGKSVESIVRKNENLALLRYFPYHKHLNWFFSHLYKDSN